jgi:hypothetical protein
VEGNNTINGYGHPLTLVRVLRQNTQENYPWRPLFESEFIEPGDSGYEQPYHHFTASELQGDIISNR